MNYLSTVKESLGQLLETNDFLNIKLPENFQTTRQVSRKQHSKESNIHPDKTHLL